MGVLSLNKNYGHRIRILHWCTEQAVTSALAGMELTAAQGHIIGYLVHRESAPCSRDIEEAFQLSHPTVSGLLARLEKKGFIEFREDSADRRSKRVHILPKGRACHAMIRETIGDSEKRMLRGFSEEEQKCFSDFLERAIVNMDGASNQRVHKEES